MDLTPRLLTEVEFREQWRGYSPNDVDDFLERVAVAVGELQEQLREALERAAHAEQRLLERSDDDEIRRILVLAQRTAVTAVEEARSEAERIFRDANDHARQQVADAEARLSAFDAEMAERSRRELAALVERRATLQTDVETLTSFVIEHRARVRAELERRLAELDSPITALAVPSPPPVSDVDELEPLPERAVEPVEAPVEAYVPRPPTEEEVAQAREDLVEALRRAGVEDLLGDAEDLTPWAPESALVAEPEPEVAPSVDGPQLYDVADESGEIDVPQSGGEPTGMYDALADDDDEADLEWREQAIEPAATGDEDDPFLAELRRAVTDTEPLGPRDVDVPPMRDDDEDGLQSGRFLRRRGR
jgi:cell division initiation protein